MSKIIVHNLMSLDGYYAGPHEDVDSIWKFWHPDYANDMSFHFFNIDLLRSSSVLLLGKKTFLDKFNVDWNKMINDSKTVYFMRELARLLSSIDKIIVSDSLTSDNIIPSSNTKIIKRKEAYDTIATLKRKSGKNIAIIGSREFWQDLLDHDLIDELHLTIAPVYSGTGTPIIDHQPGVFLNRLDTRIAEGNNMLILQINRQKS